MSLPTHWWKVLAVTFLVIYGTLALTLPRNSAMMAAGDLMSLALIGFATVVMAWNAVSAKGLARAFWILMSIGGLMWAINQMGWTYYEVIVRRGLPDPYFGDVILFIHVVPFMAAVALRPHRPQEQQKLYLGTLNFIMLLLWWLALYTFIVFPDEYVSLNAAVYGRSYNLLYLVENVALLGMLAAAASTTQGAWRRIYWNLFLACGLYTLSSEAANIAIDRGVYYTGSVYDVPFLAAICWFIWAVWLARKLKPAYGTSAPAGHNRWLAMAPRLAMLSILSLPVMGFWALYADTATPQIRQFRVLVTLASMLVLGLFVFVRQYLLDRELVRLLQESHASLENQQRLQSQLVQKEKLASLGQLVAGAAHEINNPLAAILGYSELLAGHATLKPDQLSMARKIGQQARRTRDLVSGLLSFAQQTPAEKTLVDIGALAQRAMQMEVLHLEGKKIRSESRIDANLPRVLGNANQLFQCCLQIIDNAKDALEEVGGGTFSVAARHEGDDVVLEFADSGPGIRDTRKVFDPFYTTKPIGKGTGLGLSATYGVVQDHNGQVTCHNRAEGGAVFVLRFPVAKSSAALETQAAKA